MKIPLVRIHFFPYLNQTVYIPHLDFFGHIQVLFPCQYSSGWTRRHQIPHDGTTQHMEAQVW